MSAPSPKQATRRFADRLQDDVTFEDIQYELYVLQQVERRLQDVEAGRVVARDDARAHLGRWLDPSGDA